MGRRLADAVVGLGGNAQTSTCLERSYRTRMARGAAMSGRAARRADVQRVRWRWHMSEPEVARFLRYRSGANAAEPGWRLTRRTFLKGCAVAAGRPPSLEPSGRDEFLGGLEPADAAAPAANEQLIPHRSLQQLRRRVRSSRPRRRRQGEARSRAPPGSPRRSAASKMPVRLPAAHLRAWRLPAAEPLQRRPREVPVQAGRRARLRQVAAHQLGRGHYARSPRTSRRSRTQYGKDSVWVAPYTGSLGLIEGVVGVGYRFASVTGACAGDFEGDNEGDSADARRLELRASPTRT